MANPRPPLSGMSRSHPQSDSRSHPQSDQQSHPQSDSRPHPQSDSRSQPQSDSRPHPQSDSRPHPQSDSRPHPQSDSRSHPQSDSRSHPQSDSRPHPQSDSRSHPQSDYRSHPKSDSQSNPQSDSRSHPQSDSRSQPQSDSRSHPQSDSRSHPQSDSRSHPQSDSCSHPQSDYRSHPKSDHWSHPQLDYRSHPHLHQRSNPQTESQSHPQSHHRSSPQTERKYHPQSNHLSHPQSNSRSHLQSDRRSHPQYENWSHPQSDSRSHTPSDSRSHPSSDIRSNHRITQQPVADLEDFYKEVDAIEEASTGDETDEEPKTPDEGEQERLWLKEAGYGNLVATLEEGRELEEDLVLNETASLTRTQADAVKRRVNTLHATLRELRQKTPKVDVRQVFGSASQSGTGDQETPDASTGSRATRRGEQRSSFLRRTGGYSVKDCRNDQPDCQGVETISIQSKGAPKSRRPPAGSWDPAGGDLPDTGFYIEAGNQPAANADLPTVLLHKDDLGLTWMTDLAKPDTDRVRVLALLELSALFDSHGITYSRLKVKKRPKEHGVFGVPLTTLVEHDQKRDPAARSIPKIFSQLIEFLEQEGLQEEGILRIPGSLTRTKAIRAQIEAKFFSGQFRWDDVLPNDAAGLLKQFVRELPAPLLTFEYLNAFSQVERIAGLLEKVKALNLLVLLLPDVHRNTLRVLLTFLSAVVDCTNNLMTLRNVSMIMAPNLFLVASSRRKKCLKDDELHMATGTANIVRMLIKYKDLLWSIPSAMMQQIREQFEQAQMRKFRDKPILKLLGRREKGDLLKKPAVQADYQEGVIRVLCSQLSKFTVAIHLDANTCAKDVVCLFWQRTNPQLQGANGNHVTLNKKSPVMIQNHPHDILHLYEVGGNIGERRLDPSTSMLALLRVNPNAEWVIRVLRDSTS